MPVVTAHNGGRQLGHTIYIQLAMYGRAVRRLFVCEYTRTDGKPWTDRGRVQQFTGLVVLSINCSGCSGPVGRVSDS